MPCFPLLLKSRNMWKESRPLEATVMCIYTGRKISVELRDLVLESEVPVREFRYINI